MSKEILINQLFAGRYLEEGENIGHEVINLFKDDEGNNNLFVTPSGNVKDHDIESIIFVRNIAARTTVEIVGVAKGLRRISKEEIDDVKYAGVSLNQIFSSNTYRGGIDVFSNHVTFRADVFLLPKQRIMLTIDEGFVSDETVIYLESDRKVIIPQGMREYYSDSLDALAYSQLRGLIARKDFFDEENTTKELIPDGAVYNQSPSFLEVIRKEDDENIFSNLIGYFFEYSHLSFLKFASDPHLLNIPDMRASFDLIREKKVGKKQDRIDLWIESETDIIVIENKIKSGINGVASEDYSQLNSYYEFAEDEAKKCGKKAHYYIFAPDYSRFDLTQFGLENVYRIIKYSELYDFFIRETSVYIADRAFPDFVRGLKRHTLTLPELQFDTMRSRLLRRIYQLQ